VSGICEGKVVLITGSGRGIGKGYALEFARQGAKVVVNDIDLAVAQEVVDEIKAMGGEATANGNDGSEWAGAESMVKQAIDAFGRIDVLVNNAGILRDKMLFNMAEDDWDAIAKVHLKGTFCPTRIVASHWRELSKAGQEVDGRVINTTSTSGLFGNPGQTNYGAAKAGLAAFTIIAATELGRYGVKVNAICPMARTRMTETLGTTPPVAEGQWDNFGPDNIAPIVVWLASPEAKDVTGRVFFAVGGRLEVLQGWQHGPAETKEGRWDPAELGPVVSKLLEKAAPAQGPFPTS